MRTALAWGSVELNAEGYRELSAPQQAASSRGWLQPPAGLRREGEKPCGQQQAGEAKVIRSFPGLNLTFPAFTLLWLPGPYLGYLLPSTFYLLLPAGTCSMWCCSSQVLSWPGLCPDSPCSTQSHFKERRQRRFRGAMSNSSRARLYPAQKT